MTGITRLGDDVNTEHPSPNSPVTIKVESASSNIFANDKGVERLGDKNSPHSHGTPVYATEVVKASDTVFANDKAIARIGDEYSCGAKNISGSSNIIAN